MKQILLKFKNRALNYLFSSINSRDDIEKLLIISAKNLLNSSPKKFSKIRDAEFQVFSQWGEDGIIQYLIANLPDDEINTFVEFGVEDYSESNTRFLLINNNWRGLVIDGSTNNIETIKRRNYAWRHDLTAVSAFITKGNINKLIKDAGFSDEIGLLSIDIDGNDYWVWDSIDVISPRIVIVEYNGIFGATVAVSTPYDDSFVRNIKHYSNLYYGCSLQALIDLGKKKGYTFVGSNSAGSNAFFIRNDMMTNFKEVTSKQEFIFRKFREARNPEGKLIFSNRLGQIREIAHMPLINVNTGIEMKVSDLI
jgi:hypothetical protein